MSTLPWKKVEDSFTASRSSRLIACIGLSAQTQKSEKKPVTNADVVEMVKAAPGGFPYVALVPGQQLSLRKTKFPTSANLGL